MKRVLFFVLLQAVFAAACSRHKPPATVSAAAPVAVHTTVVSVEKWPASYDATGTVRARVTATMSSKVPAYVQHVAVQQGDRVSPGQILVTLDARDLDANVSRTEAAYSEAASVLPEVDSAVAAAQANLDLAEVTFKRIEGLAAERSVSRQELDEALAKVKAARAAHEIARAKRVQVQARLAQVGQERRAAAITRDYARITAPFAGIVTARSVEPGNLAMPGAPLLTIENAGAYRLEVSIDESHIAALRRGDRRNVDIDATGCSGLARVSEIVPAVDPASRSYTVKFDLPPSDSNGHQRDCAGVRSGMFGRASISLGARDVIAIPAASLIQRGQLQFVFTLERSTARRRLVTIGERTADSVEVLSGLNAGERVLAPPPASISDGAAVEVR